MFTEDDLLPLSGLQHLLFCERQWALIHIEQQWAENRLTEEGRVLHDRVHESGTEARPDVVVARGLRVRSLRLGLSGETDVVEFQRAAGEFTLNSRTTDSLRAPAAGDFPVCLAPRSPACALPGENGAIQLEGRAGWWTPFPVEYKRGRPKSDAWDEVQLCAQALCLEEMFGVAIPAGALFYGTKRRRTQVDFDVPLRTLTESLARRMHELYSARTTPAAVYEKKCESCSLMERCMPRMSNRRRDVARYLAGALRDVVPGPDVGPDTEDGA
jgi:CRISPR-associated exonuclease Cas4